MALSFGKRLLYVVLEKGHGRCWYCGIALTLESRKQRTRETYCIDHLVPLRLGGETTIDNLVPACWLCNERKRGRLLEDFREYMTRLDHGMPRFTEEQIHFIEREFGVAWPKYSPHVFFFEKEGLS